MKNIIIIIFLFLNSLISYGQNERDITIYDSIYPILFQSDKYPQVKNLILKLEKKYGYEPELKYLLIKYSYKNNDISFFKEEIETLVEKYGFQLIYLSGNESYYESITNGYLSEWFKEMYLNKHFLWMKNNFEKQIDLKKLNEIKTKDQLIVNFSSELYRILELDSIQEERESFILNEYIYSNLNDLYQITKKYNKYPNGKSFALLQNNPYIAELHNLKSKENNSKYWNSFYPFLKKAYLNNEISLVHFKDYDNMSFLLFGNQKFGLLKIKDIQKIFLKENLTSVPIVDMKFYKSIKKEFGWK